MKDDVKIYHDRSIFAKEMLGKYQSQFPIKTISDIGSGYGKFRQMVEGLGLIWQPFDANQKLEETIIWDLNKPAPNESQTPGGALFLEVLEHLSNPELGISNISKHIPKDGILILTVPNPRSSKNKINLITKGQLYAFQDKHLEEHHVFTPWSHIVKFFLEKYDFEILEYAIVDVKYLKIKPKNLKEFIKFKIERIIEYFDPLSKGMSYGIVAKKR
jgi:SAM-dependent methyltransferase